MKRFFKKFNNTCHAELVSASYNCRGNKTLKRVQGDKTAFTLAEILITLGIIGVVAALTMPTLLTNFEKKNTAVKLKKFYNVITNATNKAIDEHGDWSTWDYSLSEKNFYEKYYKDEIEVTRIACKYSNSNFFDCDKAASLTPYLFFKDGTCAKLRKNGTGNQIMSYYWLINTSCFKTSIEGRNEFEIGLYNLRNMKYRCNYTPTMCGFKGDKNYVGDNPVWQNKRPDTASCSARSGNSTWQSYYCYYKFIKDGMTFKEDYYFNKKP